MNEDARGSPGHRDVEGAPFENDHEDQVSEKTQDKNHLGDELQNDVESVPEESEGGKHTHVQDRTSKEYQQLTILSKSPHVHFFEPCIHSPGTWQSCMAGEEEKERCFCTKGSERTRV